MINQEQYKIIENCVMKDYKNTTGIVVMKKGQLMFEQYFNDCNAESMVHVYSVTKSIVSILIGIALDQGIIKSIDQKVLDFFPEYVIKRGEKMIQQITLRDLLIMQAPFKYRIPPYIKYFTSDDWLKFTLDLLGGRKPVETFNYTPLIGPDIFTGILRRASGQSVLEFARESLFEPLGIKVEKSIYFNSKKEQMDFNKAKDISGWAADLTGLNAGGWGLTLSTLDMAKIGQLYLDNGVWEDKQIVSEQWVRLSTQRQNFWEREKLAYGYLWWVVDEEKRSAAAVGDGGNVIYYNTEHDLVIAVTSHFVPRAKDRLAFIKNTIEPLFTD